MSEGRGRRRRLLAAARGSGCDAALGGGRVASDRILAEAARARDAVERELANEESREPECVGSGTAR
jgi:hypothetical protein